MKRKILFCLFALLLLFSLAGCGNKEDKSDRDNNRTHEKSEEKKKENKKEQEEKEIEDDDIIEDDEIIDDDEILDLEDDENPPIINDKNVTVEQVINCEGCVYAYFSAEGNDAKKLGDIVTESEYTSDINTIKTSGGKQRHNFFGLVLSGNTISKAYSCILKENKIYCIQGSTDGTYHQNNIGILNQIFTADQCKTLSEGHNYWCSDGSYNGNSKTNGYTALHYETSCTIYGADSNTGKLICH